MNLKIQKAFTLLEVVIAIAIMANILSVAYRGVTSIASAKVLLDDQREVMQIANSLISRFTRELQMAGKLGKLISPEYDNHEFFGENRRSGDNDTDLIAFMAKSAGQYVPDGQTHSGTVQISLMAQKDSELTAENTDTLVLVRDEVQNIKPVEKAFENRITFPLTKNLLSLDFAYFDNKAKQWRNEWKNIPGLPALVRIKIGLKTDKGEVLTFQTVVPIKEGF